MGVAKNESHLAHLFGQGFDFIIFFVAVCLPFIDYLDLHHSISAEVSHQIHWAIWFIFTLELTTMLLVVRHKFIYLITNWLNLLIISLTFPLFWFHTPMFGFLRVLVIMRVLLPWWDKARDFLSRNHLFYTLVVFFAVVLIGGAGISLFDDGIKNPWDGIWWAVQTITTVGYGDVIPISTAGRIFAIGMMLMGVALFSILTANFSAYLLGKEPKRQTQQVRILKIIAEIEARNIRIEHQLNNLEIQLASLLDELRKK